MPPRSRQSAGLRISFFLLCAGLFLVYLDTTIINVALPSIRADLSGGRTSSQWVIDAYTVAFACLLLSAGALGDIVGRKSIFLIGLAGFTAASILCAVSSAMTGLLIGRTAQGFFAATLIPTSLAIISGLFKDVGERARAIGIWAGIGGLALASGPIVGGWLVETYGWRSIFWLNVPIGLIAALGLRRLLPGMAGGTRRLDTLGQLLFIVSMASMTFGLIEGNEFGWDTLPILAAFLVGIASMAAFVVRERQANDPMLPLLLLRSKILVVACIVNFFNFFAFFAVLFTMTFYWQGVGRLSPFDAGLRFLTLTVPIMIASYLASAVTTRTGAKMPIFLGALSTVLALAGLAWLPPDAGLIDYGWPLALLGAGGSFAAAPASVAILAATPPQLAGTASGIWNTCRQSGAVVGVAVAGLFIATGAVESADPALFAAGMHITLLVAAVGNALGALAVAFAMPNDWPRAVKVPG